MATTGKQINTHFSYTVNMKTVREVLPPNHHIRELDETIPEGVLKAGDYFVTMLDRFCGKRKQGNTYIVRLRLFAVLKDGTRDDRTVKCFMSGPHCEALAENLITDLDTQGTWSADRFRKEGKVVWIVLHQAFVMPCKECKEFKGYLEFTVYSTTMVCICTQDEDNHLVWHSHSKNSPHDTEYAEVALQLFDWWAKDGRTFQFGWHGVQPSSSVVSGIPTLDIAHAVDKGRFTLHCQVVKKTVYPASTCPMVVLRVRDGTRSSFRFEEINYNPSIIVHNRKLVIGVHDSLEVDILVMSDVVPQELDKLELGTFVKLKGVESNRLYGDCRKFVFLTSSGTGCIKLLGDDDPELLPLKDRVLKAIANQGTASSSSSSGQL
ncbi:hypothetical protein O3P69_005734 [Scylla paramamosain]|uniref:Uncharacterized protein n=1 Tax=Scylla paramamosain TaxID=85552 RepID=A0AAW0UC25_SCYPA